MQAQVTIGSNAPAKSGALLDLKEGSDNNTINSTKGLMLPRLKLTDKNNLYPIFESPITPGQPNEKYNTLQKKEEQDALHTGLLIYNLNTCKGFSSGTYIWNGDRWDLVGPDKSTPLPTVNISVTGGNSCIKTEWDAATNTVIVHIPSGKDLRSLTNPIQAKIDWTPATVNLIKGAVTDDLLNKTLSDSGSDRYARGGIVYTNNPPSGWDNPSGGTKTFTFEVQSMADTGAADDLKIGWGDDYIEYPHNSGTWIPALPWRSRQTTVEFSVTEDVCNETTPLTVIFNQTNYHLWVGRNDWNFSQSRRVKDDRQYYRFLITPINEGVHSGWNGIAAGDGWDGNTFKFQTESNSWWKLSDIGKTNDFDDIIADLGILLGRQNTNKGQGEFRQGQPPIAEDTRGSLIKGLKMEAYPYGQQINYANNPSLFAYTGVPDRKYKTAARLRLSADWDCPLYPDVDVDIVQCAADFDKRTIEKGSDLLESSWAEKVLSHEDQNGNTFYSTKFGNDRWMITNLAATSYADGTPLSPLTSEKANFYDIENAGTFYTYPLAGDPDPSIDSNSEWKDIDPQNIPGQGHTGYYKKWYPEYGALYNWYATTRQPADYTSHVHNEGQAYPSDDPSSQIGEFEIERKLETSSGARDGKIQGICPYGWHLPTDREWNDLERFFYNKIRDKDFSQTQYDNDDAAKVQADIDAGRFPVWNTDWEITVDASTRGYNVNEWKYSQWDPSLTKGTSGHIGHGGAMKAVCPPINLQQSWLHSSKGYSAEPRLGGFNVIPLGRMMLGESSAEAVQTFIRDNPKADNETISEYVQRSGINEEHWRIVLRDYAYDAVLWTASASGPITAWCRNFPRYEASVIKEAYMMTYMANVRCVKD